MAKHNQNFDIHYFGATNVDQMIRDGKIPDNQSPIPASEVVQAEQNWLFPGWIPAGKLTLIIGALGVGKSLLATDIAARVSRGDAMPLTYWNNRPANVLMFTLQDHITETVAPRLSAANADMSKVHIFADGGLEQCTNPRLLELLIDEYEATLVVIDPISSDICRKQANKRLNADTEIGSLTRVAEFTGAAILMVHAIPEPSESTARIGMARSLRMASAARSVLHVSHQHDSENRLLQAVKGNLSLRPQGLRFRMKAENSDSYPSLEWLEMVESKDDYSDVTPTAAYAMKHAQNFLRSTLQNGAIESRVLREMARENGISVRTLERARKRIVRAVRVNDHGSSGKWMAELITTKE